MNRTVTLRLLALVFGAGLVAWGCGDGSKQSAKVDPAHPSAASPAVLATLSSAERLAHADDRLKKDLAASAEGFARHADGLVSAGWRKPRLGAFHSVGSRVDLSSARAPWEIALGKSESYRLRLVPIEAAAVPGAESGGRVVYAGAYPDADLLLAANAAHTEALVLMKSERAPDRYRFRVELGSGFSMLRQGTSGEVEVLDAGGSPRLIVQRPYALDATGKRRDAELSLGEREIALRLDTKGLAFPILLDPVIQPAIWRYVKSPGLTQRNYASLAYDPERGETVLFGGDDGKLQSDTWTWNGSTWKLRSTLGPLPRGNVALAWDPGRKVLVLFDGRNNYTTVNTFGNETWEWDGTSWTLRSSANSPPPLNNPVAVTFRNKVLLVGFAGSGNGTQPSETWEWDGTNWTNKAPATVPTSVRTNTLEARALVADAVRNVAVLLTQNGLWEWNGTDWTAISPASRPNATFPIAGGYVGGKVVFLASSPTIVETWTWDGTTFTKLTTAAAPRGVNYTNVSADADRGLVLFGGTTSDSYVTSSTWEFDGTNWSQRTGEQAPQARRYPGLTYDPVRQRMLVFGGTRGAGSGTAMNELWSYDGAGWKFENSNPSTYCGAPVTTWGNKLGAMVVHNCQAGVTWLWNGTNWTFVAAGGPAITTNTNSYYAARLAEDSARDVVVAVTADNVRQTWEFNGTTWTPITTPTVIAPGLGLGLGLADAAPGILLFDAYASTWTYRGGDWLRMQPPASPPGSRGANINPILVRDPARQSVLALVRAGTAMVASEWIGGNWVTAPVEGPAPSTNSIDGNAAYDARRGKLVYFGDLTDTSLYEFQLRGGPCDADTDCDTGHCVDGACCETATCPACHACNVAQQAGVCAPAIDLSHPPECPAPSTCGASGTCGKAKGAACAANDECGSRLCSDGVCCDRDCSAACNRCDLPGKAGTCTPVASGDPGSNPSCAPYVCKGQDVCPAACSTNADCAGGTAGAGKCVSGKCVALKAPGATCSAGTECGTGFCPDGVCCNVACTGLCQGCRAVRTGLAEGTCGPIADGTACGSASCNNGITQGQICVGGNCTSSSRPCAPFVCTGNTCGTSCTTGTDCVAGSNCVGEICTGGTDDGRGCLRGSDCKSGYCVDRVCCATSCDGECQACSSDRKADGSPSGTCGKALAGMPCGLTTCAPVTDVINGQLCSVQGTCLSSSLLCTPYHCDAQGIGCRTTCTSNDHCQAGFECSAGHCRGILPAGATCQYREQCASGHCVDGVCCDSACDGACESCATSFNLGTCKPLPAGDPGAPTCAPYKCSGTSGACATSCASDADCTGTPCANGTCKLRPDGEPCTANAECETKICAGGTCGERDQGAKCTADVECKTKHCVDGVCCNSACTGCQACSKEAKGKPNAADGTCENVASGVDPHNACKADERTSCGQDGSCNDTGGCRLWGAGTPCGEGTRCDGDVVIGQLCDGKGDCKDTPDGFSCANQGAHCIDGACADPCANFKDPCQFGTHCDAVTGKCAPSFKQGDQCTANYQCQQALCVDGYCCNDACDQSSCMACDVPDHKGECVPVPAGQLPHGKRAPCINEHPLCAGSCNGTSGDCSYPVTQCKSECKDGTASYTSCNLGTCSVPSPPQVCSPYACNAAKNDCLKGCTSDADCAQGFECRQGDGGTPECVPKPNGRCLADEVTLEDTTSGRRINCVAYKCQNDRCKEVCANSTDCQKGFVCDTSNHCKLPPEAFGGSGGAPPASDDGCGCRIAGEPDRRGAAWLAALGALALLQRQRSRRARFSNKRGRASGVPPTCSAEKGSPENRTTQKPRFWVG